MKEMKRRMKKAKKLRPCRFWAPPFGEGGSSLAKPGRIRPGKTAQVQTIFASTWEEAIEELKCQMKDRGMIMVRRLLEETEQILRSEKFQGQWDRFIASVPGKHGCWTVIDRVMTDKATRRRLVRFYRDWGLCQMNGWWPVIPYTPYSVRQRQIYRCESCARRHYQQQSWPLDLDALNKKARCCRKPSLKPFKIEVNVEVYQDQTKEEWEGIRKRLGYSAMDLVLGMDILEGTQYRLVPIYSSEESKHRIPPRTLNDRAEVRQYAKQRYNQWYRVLRKMKKSEKRHPMFKKWIDEQICKADRSGYRMKPSSTRGVADYAYALVLMELADHYDYLIGIDTLKRLLYS